MTRKIIVFCLFFSFLNADLHTRLENSNFTVSQDDILYNYNRLRMRSDYKKQNFFGTVIGDIVHYQGEDYLHSTSFLYLNTLTSNTPFQTQSERIDKGKSLYYAKIYRLYAGYENDSYRVILGLQNIAMGVGHIWTPTNLFNPKNIYSLEPDETYGVMALSYTQHISDKSKLRLVVSPTADKTLKYALQYKGYWKFADVALDIIYANNSKMIGYEIEGNLADTGIELRTEGAYIQMNINNKEEIFFQTIIGADYGFVNGISLSTEMFYSSKIFSNEELFSNQNTQILPSLVNANFYTAFSLSYSVNIFLDTSILYIQSKEINYLAPSINYTLNDYNSFILGAILNISHSNSYYFKWQLSF